MARLCTAKHNSGQLRVLDGFLTGSNPGTQQKKQKTSRKGKSFVFVAKLGFEPRQTEPESVVLPLHHLAISNIRLSVNGNRISIRLTSRGALEYELSYQ